MRRTETGYRIAKMFRFEAAHRLPRVPAGHPCARLHGHSYRVRLLLAADGLDERGMVWDFNDLGPFADYLREQFDHRTLNEIVSNPTAENLARWLLDVARDLLPGAPIVAVRVQETETCWAEVVVTEELSA